MGIGPYRGVPPASTFRQPEYSTTPTRALPDAASIVVGAFAYRRREPPVAVGPTPHGRVASYAWEEYYAPLKVALGAIAQRLRADGWRTRVVVDDNALVDRAAAVRAGIAWPGKSGNVLLPGRGSWFVLGSVLTDAPLVRVDPAAVADGCGSCRRCIDGCPTAAIIAPGVVDARRCLSWLLQAPGSFPVAFREALGDRIYGCDDCQEVCPPNRRDDATERPEAGLAARAYVDLLDLLDADDATVLERHGRWYIAGRNPRWVRRNALVVLANTAPLAGHSPAELDARVETTLTRILAGADDVLVAHAVWAARRLGYDHVVPPLAAHPDASVREEYAAHVTRRPSRP